MRTPPSRPPTTLRSHACSLGPALHRCQAFAPPASGITRAMAVRNSGAPRPATTGPVTHVIHDLHTLPARHSCAASPSASLPTRPRCSCQHHTLRVRVAASSVEMAAKKRPKKKPVKKQVRYGWDRWTSLGIGGLVPRPTSSTPSHDVFIAPRPPPRRRATTATCSSTRAPRASPAIPTPSSTGSASRSRASPTRRVTWSHGVCCMLLSWAALAGPAPPFKVARVRELPRPMCAVPSTPD